MLPSYSKLYEREAVDRDADASNPLLGSSNPEITDTLPPIYPPSSSSTLPPLSAVRHNVEYTYKPVYPRKGSAQYAVGPLGRTKQETIEIVQRGIPGLAEFDSSRILFQKNVAVSGTSGGQLATILDEAWEHFPNSPPAALSVVIADEPGEKERRDTRQTRIVCSFLLCMLIMCTFPTIFAITMTWKR